jgi:hypothetical protein
MPREEYVRTVLKEWERINETGGKDKITLIYKIGETAYLTVIDFAETPKIESGTVSLGVREIVEEYIGHKFDLVKLISTEAPTETTSEEPQPKTLSEYLKENNAYESFVENSVENFLNDIDVYNEMKLENDIIYLGNAFNWRGTEQGNDYWYNLHNTQPYDLIYDMNEIIFAEVDRRITKQKTESEVITNEFNEILEKAPKRYMIFIEGKDTYNKIYMIFIEGKDTYNKIYTDLEKAETEAKRLATTEVGVKVSIVKIVKEYKSKVDVYEV